MFWGSDLRFEGAHYFASENIERIQDGIIHGYLNEHRAQRADAFRRDLPSRYRLQLTTLNNNGNGSTGNAIVDAISISPDASTVSLQLRESARKYVYPPDAPTPDATVTTKTRDVPLCDLHFKYRDSSVRERNILPRHFEWNEMRVPRRAILDNFYRDLLQALTKRTRGFEPTRNKEGPGR